MPRALVILAAVVTAAILGSSCGEPEAPAQLFTPGQARETAQRFGELVIAGKSQELIALCRAPFAYRTRTWKSDQDVAANLPGQIALLKAEIEDADAMEVCSYNELRLGRWPRGENVPEDQRGRRLAELGVAPEGYVVRIYHEPRRGVYLVLNSDMGVRLLVQGVR